MLVRYEKAASNDIGYIRELIKSNPGIINDKCTVVNKNSGPVDDNIIFNYSGLALSMLAMAGSSSLIALPIFTVAAYYFAAKSMKPEKYFRSRLNWTMLDYAAEAGATSVAVYLIIRGADTSNDFYLKLAKANGHNDLYAVCLMMSTVRDKLTSKRGKLLRLRSEIDELNESLRYNNSAIRELESQKETALDEIEKNIMEIKLLEEQVKAWEDLYSETPEIIDKALPAVKEKIPKVSSNGMYSGNNHNGFPFGLIDKKVPFVPGDCFFDAVIANASNPLSKKILREGINRVLIENRCDNDAYIDHGVNLLISQYNEKDNEYETIEIPCSNYNEYCDHILHDGAWVDDIEIKAMCTAFKMCCVIVPKDFLSESIVFGAEFSGDDNPPIILGYIDRNHYVALQCSSGNTPFTILEKVQRLNAANHSGQREEIREGFNLC